jgi:hypothetical protein
VEVAQAAGGVWVVGMQRRRRRHRR